MSLPRIRKDFKCIVTDEKLKAILFRDFDGKEYWIPRSLCTLIKQKDDRVIVTIAAFKFEEITGTHVEPLETTFATLGGDILPHHLAPGCPLIESAGYPLKPKQRELVTHHIRSLYTAWLAEAGTGKTLCTTTIAYSRWRAGLISHTFILCPASLQKQWKDLIKLYYPDFTAFTVMSTHSASMDVSLQKSIAKFRKEKGDVQLIVDESHLIRNQSARRSRNIEKKFPAKYVQIATAFPIERNAADLFYQFGTMNRKIIGEENYGAFQAKFLLFGGNDGEQIVAYQNTAELKRRISPYIARMTLAEVHSTLPEIEFHNVYFPLNTEQKQAYAALENLLARLRDNSKWVPAHKKYMINTFLLKLSSGYTPSEDEIKTTFADLGRLGESADNLRKIGAIAYNPHNNRIKKLRETLGEIGNEQVIIWCSFVDEIKTIADELPRAVAIFGEIDLKERDHIIEKFKAAQVQYLVISVAINEGFNLQCCRNAILYSDNYSRTKRENAIKRIHRIGQDKQCRVYRLLAEKSVDIRILEVGKRKDKICNIFDNESVFE